MPKPYPIELRERVISKYRENKSIDEIMNELNVSRSFVYTTLALNKKNGSVEAKKPTGGRKFILDEEDMEHIKLELQLCPDMTLRELKDKLNLPVAISTLCDTINYRMKLVYKKKLCFPKNKIERML